MMDQHLEHLQAARQEKDAFFKTSPYSPLSPQQQVSFNALNYFDPNPALAFEIAPEPYPDQAHIKMQTSTGDVRQYQRWGRVRFTVDGEETQLTLYYAPGQPAFFVPFTDTTTGNET